MRYFKYKNTDKNRNQALKAQYKSLAAEEKRTVRREKRWRWMHNALSFVIFFLYMVAVVRLLKLVPVPTQGLLRFLASIGRYLIGLLLSIPGAVLAGWLTTPLRKKADSFHIASMKKEIFSAACAHLREYYGLKEPYLLTKCFGSSDPKFRDHDVCIFITGDELRITTDLINGFLHGSRDLGCYAFQREEVILTKQYLGEQLIAELNCGDAVFLLGYRAKGFIERHFLTKQPIK